MLMEIESTSYLNLNNSIIFITFTKLSTEKTWHGFITQSIYNYLGDNE